MIKLKEIIQQLSQDEFELMEGEFVKTKAEKFRYLFTSYRNNAGSDEEISNELKLNQNAYYTLKSRLFEKIRSRLSSVENFEKNELMKTLARIPELCTTTPRETANAMLQQLEIDLMKHGMHNELLPVYSALKKINVFAPKYYSYSQQYNRQVAYSIAVEKAEEVLCNFSKLLTEFYMSGDEKLSGSLYFLTREINNIYELNQSRMIQLIRNLTLAQYYLYCGNSHGEEGDSAGLLESCIKIVSESPDPVSELSYDLAAHTMLFNLYVQEGKMKVAEKYLQRLQDHFASIPLLNFVTCPSAFYEQYIVYNLALGKRQEVNEAISELMTDSTDELSLISLNYFKALALHYSGDNKAAVQVLKKLINDHSLLNLDKKEIEIKLTLAWLLILQKEFEQADSVYKKIMRKIKSSGSEVYAHTNYIGKLFDFEINKDNSSKNEQRKKELYTLFSAANRGKSRILACLEHSLREKYQI